MQDEGNEVVIIDYYPQKYDKNFKWLLKSLNPIAIKKKLREYRKETKLKSFRARLKKTNRFFSTAELHEELLDYDVLITGSDQVWNEAFTLRGEGKITKAYYLPFEKVKIRISYAASFGYSVMSEEIKSIIVPLLKSLSAISVREKSGQKMLEEIGIQSQLVCDPTLLLPAQEYEKLTKIEPQKPYIAKYILRRQDVETNVLIDAIIRMCRHDEPVIDIEMTAIDEWLSKIYNASMLITNSFHGVVFALIFHTPFWVFLENTTGKGMNDRLLTLLSSVNLQDRIVRDVSMANGEDQPIDWNSVDNMIGIISADSKAFLKKSLEEK